MGELEQRGQGVEVARAREVGMSGGGDDLIMRRKRRQRHSNGMVSIVEGSGTDGGSSSRGTHINGDGGCG